MMLYLVLLCLLSALHEQLVFASASSSVLCGAGQYSDTTSNTCTDCPAGRYSTTVGSTTISDCIVCPIGTYYPYTGAASAASCLSVPNGYSTTKNGSDVFTDCNLCKAGYYAGSGSVSYWIHGDATDALCSDWMEEQNPSSGNIGARYKHSMVTYVNTSSVSGTVAETEYLVVFGGSDGSFSLGDVWINDLENFKWMQMTTSGITVPDSIGHTALLYNKFYMMATGGGLGSSLYTLNLFHNSTVSMEWSIRTTTGASLPAASYGSSVLLNDTILVYFGGSILGSPSNDVYTIDLVTNVVTQLSPTGSVAARSEHVAVLYDNRYMYVHGGITASAYLDDLVKLDLQTNIWSTITLSTAEGSCPTARSGHVVVLYEDYMVIYGGAGNAGTIFQDVYSIDLKTSKCYGTLKKNSGLSGSGTAPSRWLGTASLYTKAHTASAEMVIFAGLSGGTVYLDDVWRVNLTLPCDCSLCTAGTYTNVDNILTSCTLCNSGKYNPNNGSNAATDCIDCAAGTYDSTAGGATACTDCAVGKSNPIAGQNSVVACQACATGKYGNVAGLATCVDCDAGKANANTGSTAATDCVNCAAGLYAVAGSDACVTCDAGTTVGAGLGLNAASCQPCAGGTYADLVTVFECTDCPIGEFSAEGAELCTPCLPGTFTDVIGSETCSLCPIGFVSAAAGAIACDACPGGRITPVEGTVDEAECVSPQINFYTAFATLGIIVPIAIEYIIHARFHRIAFLRQQRVTQPLIAECKAFATRVYYTLMKAKAEKVIHPDKKPWRALLFLILSLVAGSLVTFCVFLVIMASIFFKAMIVWRGFSISVSFEDIMNTVVAQLSFLTGLEVLAYIFYPVIYMFNLFSTFEIDLEAVAITCDGASAPMGLLINLIVLGLAVIIIESDYQVFRAISFKSITDKFFEAAMQPQYRKWTTHRANGVNGATMKASVWGMAYYTGLLFTAFSVLSISSIDIFQGFLQYLMSLLTLYRFVSVNGMHPYTDSCNNVVSFENFDTIIAYAATLEAYLLMLPFFYEVSKLLVPGLPLWSTLVTQRLIQDRAYRGDPKHSWMHAAKYTSFINPDLWMAYFSEKWLRYVGKHVRSETGINRNSMMKQYKQDMEAENGEEYDSTESAEPPTPKSLRSRRSARISFTSDLQKIDPKGKEDGLDFGKRSKAYQPHFRATLGLHDKANFQGCFYQNRPGFDPGPNRKLENLVWSALPFDDIENYLTQDTEVAMLCIDRDTGLVKYAHIYDVNDSNLTTKPIFVNTRFPEGPEDDPEEHIITRTLKDFKEDLQALSEEDAVILYTMNSPFKSMSSAFDPPDDYGDGAKEDISKKMVNRLEGGGVRCEDNEAFQQLGEILISTFKVMTKATLLKMYEYNSFLFIGIPKVQHWCAWSVEQPLQCDVKFRLIKDGFTDLRASDGVESFDLKEEGLVSARSVKSRKEGYRPYSDKRSIASIATLEETSGKDGSLREDNGDDDDDEVDSESIQFPTSDHSLTSHSSFKSDKIDYSSMTLFQRFSHYWCGPSESKSLLLSAFRNRTEEENEKWKNKVSTNLPSYYTLCKFEYIEMRKWYEDRISPDIAKTNDAINPENVDDEEEEGQLTEKQKQKEAKRKEKKRKQIVMEIDHIYHKYDRSNVDSSGEYTEIMRDYKSGNETDLLDPLYTKYNIPDKDRWHGEMDLHKDKKHDQKNVDEDRLPVAELAAHSDDTVLPPVPEGGGLSLTHPDDLSGERPSETSNTSLASLSAADGDGSGNDTDEAEDGDIYRQSLTGLLAKTRGSVTRGEHQDIVIEMDEKGHRYSSALTKPDDRGIVSWYTKIWLIFLCIIGYGHIRTEIGWEVVKIVGGKYIGFMLLCLGVWTDDMAQSLDIERYIYNTSLVGSKPKRTMSKSAYDRHRKSTRKRMVFKKDSWLYALNGHSNIRWGADDVDEYGESMRFRELQQEELKRKYKQDSVQTLYNIVATRAVILQIVPQFALLSILASTTSASPIYVFPTNLRTHIPDLFVTDPFQEIYVAEKQDIYESHHIRKNLDVRQNRLRNPSYEKSSSGRYEPVDAAIRKKIHNVNVKNELKLRACLDPVGILGTKETDPAKWRRWERKIKESLMANTEQKDLRLHANELYQAREEPDLWVVVISGFVLSVVDSRFINILVNLFKFALTCAIILVRDEESLRIWLMAALVILTPYVFIGALEVNVLLGSALDITDDDLIELAGWVGWGRCLRRCLLYFVDKEDKDEYNDVEETCCGLPIVGEGCYASIVQRQRELLYSHDLDDDKPPDGDGDGDANGTPSTSTNPNPPIVVRESASGSNEDHCQDLGVNNDDTHVESSRTDVGENALTTDTAVFIDADDEGIHSGIKDHTALTPLEQGEDSEVNDDDDDGDDDDDDDDDDGDDDDDDDDDDGGGGAEEGEVSRGRRLRNDSRDKDENASSMALLTEDTDERSPSTLASSSEAVTFVANSESVPDLHDDDTVQTWETGSNKSLESEEILSSRGDPNPDGGESGADHLI